MQTALRLNTTVLAGHRIEITAPELPEGTSVELIVLPGAPVSSAQAPRVFQDVIDFLDSLAPVRRTPDEWAEVEREFREERASWDL
ncbi:MAG TPA: hypothetical protein VFJ58_16670 [Armatimonadota bacterium]|nr:hypothetical protein [Armatimonadota bacterium]